MALEQRARLLQQVDTGKKKELPPVVKKTPLTLVADTKGTERTLPDTLPAFLLMSKEMKLLARNRAKQLGKNPDVYPEEPETVRDFSKGVVGLWRSKNVEFAKYLSRLAFSYLRGGMQGIDDFISENLDQLISDIKKGTVADFDAHTGIKSGDNALAFLAQCGASLKVVEKLTPTLIRKEYNFHEGGEKSPVNGVTIFVCGYGAPLRLYEKIFALMNTPVIAYQLPHDVISANPQDVMEAFDEVYNEMYRGLEKDGRLGKITHVIGNSTGSMFATKLALRLSKENGTKNGQEGEKREPVKLALVQTGTNWPDAMERATGKFARQVRAAMNKDKNNKITWEMFKRATNGYNPIDRTGDLAQMIKEGQLDLSIFAGLNDRNISRANEVVDPLLRDLDSRRVSYDAYVSKEAGHQSAVLLFLWLCIHNMTGWGDIFKDSGAENGWAQETTDRYHVRKANKEPAMV